MPSPAGEVREGNLGVGEGDGTKSVRPSCRCCRPGSGPLWSSVSPLIPGMMQGINSLKEKSLALCRAFLQTNGLWRVGLPKHHQFSPLHPCLCFSQDVCPSPLHQTNIILPLLFHLPKNVQNRGCFAGQRLDAWAPPSRPGSWPPKIQGLLF